MKEKVKIIKEHKSNYPDPIKFNLGDSVTILKRDSEYKNWIFVSTQDNNEGWAPVQYIDVKSDSTGIANSTYTARELNTKVGEEYLYHYELNEWIWVEGPISKGVDIQTGWIPNETIEKKSIKFYE